MLFWWTRRRDVALRVGMIFGVAALGAATVRSAAPQNSARESRDRHVLMTVLDRNDAPVTDITAADVVVREDGAVREVARVSRATGPLQIGLLVDDSQAAQGMPSELQQALTGFVQRIAKDMPDSEMSIVTFGERPTTIAPFTTSAAVLTRAIGNIFPRTGSGAYMLEALDETSRALKKRSATRPVIVAFVVEDGPEFSTLSHQNVAKALQDAGASLWTVLLHGRRAPTSTDDRERATVISDVGANSGGGVKAVLDKQGLDHGFKSVADLLTSQLDVAYSRPDRLIPPSKLEITVKKPDLRVWAPRWTGPR